MCMTMTKSLLQVHSTNLKCKQLIIDPDKLENCRNCAKTYEKRSQSSKCACYTGLPNTTRGFLLIRSKSTRDRCKSLTFLSVVVDHFTSRGAPHARSTTSYDFTVQLAKPLYLPGTGAGIKKVYEKTGIASYCHGLNGTIRATSPRLRTKIKQRRRNKKRSKARSKATLNENC